MHVTQVDAHLIHSSGALSTAYARVQVQETFMALLPLRPLLLHYNSQLRLHMAYALELDVVDSMLLHVARLPR